MEYIKKTGTRSSYGTTFDLYTAYIVADGKIYFHGAKEGHKNNAIKKYSKASYCLVDKGTKNNDEWWYTFKSVIVFGKIRILNEKNEKIDKLRHL